MTQTTASLIHYLGNFGLFAAVVGLAVILLMPDRTGLHFGARLAVLGTVAMGYEVVLLHAG